MPPWSQGPFYSYVSGYTTAEMVDALEDVDHFIEQNGPFDGILGFSQGASIAIAYILQHQLRKPGVQLPFNFAVLFSSVGACSADDSCNRQIVEKFLFDTDEKSRKQFPYGGFETMGAEERTFAEYLATCHLAIKTIGISRPTIHLDFLDNRKAESVPRLLHPRLNKERVGIPTVHVTGRKDLESMVNQSLIVQGLCDETILRAHRHTGGHALPSKKQEIKAVVSSIEWATERGDYMSGIYGMGELMS
ncbi:hypothetical protein CC79DRAFT_1388158 [Sarocladium strictum]